MTQEEAALLGVCPRTFRRYIDQLQALFPQVGSRLPKTIFASGARI